MIKKPDVADVEKLSLEFAKEMIDFSDNGDNAVISEDLIKRATTMAIDWLKGKEQRSKIFEQQCVNWNNLAEKDLARLDLQPYKKYWFIGRPYASTEPLELLNGVFIKSVEGEFINAGKSVENRGLLADIRDDNDNEYIAQYVILEEDGKVFNENFEPLPPKGVNVKNNKFSPTMSAKD